MMRAVIGLYASYEVQNRVHKIALDLNRRYGVPFLASLKPAHITLKQPFAFESIERLERYFDALAGSIAPFEIELDRVYHARWDGYGFLGLDVRDTRVLRDLHARINRELAEIFEDTSAPHDGEAYHFHLTIEMGTIEGEDPYRRYYEEMVDKTLDLRFTARHIGMAYAPGEGAAGSFMTYKVLALTGKARSVS
jgi:2'-5' RNA ligase